jgi:tRNA dimethylallyltransferase
VDVKQALFIAGPTASGKSALSLRLAKDLNGVIINADSMQVYDGLRIVTACPSAADEAAAPHRLYRFLDPAQTCSAAFWAEKARAEIDAAWAKGQTPIVIGGTGMYFKVLLEGIAKIPEIDPEIRIAVRAECEEAGSAKLHEELAAYDPEAYRRLAQADSQRISRAVEVYRSTGKALSDWHKETEPGLMQPENEAGLVKKLIINPERDALYQRCNLRFDLMLEEGALEEVAAFMERSLDPSLPAMRALGVPSLIAILNGSIDEDMAIEDAKMQTRRFAKRQLTWFRNQFSDWKRIPAQLSESDYGNLLS